MSSNNPIKKYLLFFVVIPIAALCLSANLAIEHRVEKWMVELVENDLASHARSISKIFDVTTIDKDIETMNPFITRFASETPYRVTIINQEGVVLADSWVDTNKIAEVKNHADRPELIHASTKKPGTSIRFSNTVNEDLMYLAIPFSDDAFTGYIRVAIPLATTNEYLKELRYTLISMSVVGFLILMGILAFGIFQLEKINRKHTDEMRERTADITEIQKFGQMLTACETIGELTDAVTTTAELIFGKSKGAIALTHASVNSIEILTVWGEEWNGKIVYSPSDCWAFRRGTQHLSDEHGINLTCKHLDISDPVLCIPLQSQGISLGTLNISVAEDKMTAYFKDKVLAVAEHISLTLSNINLRNKLEQQAIRDPLTNLFNRRYLDESFAREIDRAERRNASIGILMIDIDHFKKFNDAFGHNAGDYVIQKVSTLLTSVIRGEDIACRYGGEEFTIILSDADLEIVKERAIELLERTRNLTLEYNKRSLGHISMSIGIAMYPDHGDSPHGLIAAADAALYRAKKAGRDQFKIADSVNLIKSKTVEDFIV